MKTSTNLIFKKGEIQLKIDNLNLTNSLFYFLVNDVNIKESINREIARVKSDLILIDASIVVLKNLDIIINIVRSSENEIELEKSLQKHFLFTKLQANYVANIDLDDFKTKNFETLKLLMNNYLVFLHNALIS